MIWQLLFLAIFLVPVGSILYMVRDVYLTQSRSKLLFLFISNLCSGLVYAFIFSRFAFPYLYVFFGIMVFTLWKAKNIQDQGEPISKWRYILPVLTLVSSLYFTVEEYKSNPTQGYDIPKLLEDGSDLIVAKGGNTVLFNHHVMSERQRYALDIGTRINVSDTWGMLTGDLQLFSIFARSILSPCSGKVLSASLSMPDQKPGHAVEAVPEGNAIEILCQAKNGKSYVFRFAHIKQYSSVLRPGDLVTKGQVIGAVGNTGNTSWPHLHLDITESDSQKAIPIFIEGTFVRAGERIAW